MPWTLSTVAPLHQTIDHLGYQKRIEYDLDFAMEKNVLAFFVNIRYISWRLSGVIGNGNC